MIWKNARRPLDLSRRGAIMGILNVTPDSFFDGGEFLSRNVAVSHARQMIQDGAAIVDVGGESTRPGSVPISVEEEMERVLPVIRELRAQEADVLISIDTSKAAVAEAALRAGADIINDVTAFRGDEAMAGVAAAYRAGVCLMHLRGSPVDMQHDPRYNDVVSEVRIFLEQSLARAVAAGIPRNHVALDPGIGFGKSREHNLSLLRDIPALSTTTSDRPLLLGVSRKSFLGGTTAERDWPTVALTALLRARGVRIFRVHDVRPNHEALRMTEAILAGAT